MKGGGHLSKVPVPLGSSIQKVYDMNAHRYLITTFFGVGLHNILPGHRRVNHEGWCLSWFNLFTSCSCYLGQGEIKLQHAMRDRTSIQTTTHGTGDTPPVLLQEGWVEGCLHSGGRYGNKLIETSIPPQPKSQLVLLNREPMEQG